MKNTLLKILILTLSLTFGVFCFGGLKPVIASSAPASGQIQEVQGSAGLKYEVKKSGGKNYAICTGIGTCKDTDIIIASHYNGAVVTEIKQQAFKDNKNIKTVKFSSGLEDIGMYAFSGCTSLTSVTLPKSLKNIKQNAFADCVNLLNICNDSDLELVMGSSNHGYVAEYACNIYKSNSGSDGVIKTEGNFKLFTFKDNVFILEYNGDSSNITFPQGVTGLCKDVFKGSSIEVLNLPTDVTYIGKNVFYNCTSLKTVNIPKNSKLKSVGEAAFFGCTALTDFNFDSTLYDYLTIDFMTAESNPIFFTKSIKIEGEVPTDIVIPSGIKVIKSNLFKNCLDVKSVTLSPTVEELEVSVFEGCTNLEAFNMHPNGNLKKLGISTFRSCSSLRKLNFPRSLESIGLYCFKDCTALQTIDFENNNNIKTIEEEAFNSCRSLVSVFFGHYSGLKTVGKNAFQYCSNLSYFRLGNYSTIEEIGYGALQGCKTLKELYVPKSCNLGYVCLSGLFIGPRDGGAYCTISVEVDEIPLDYAGWFNPSNCPIELGVPYPVEQE